jgi:hypothetical protein
MKRIHVFSMSQASRPSPTAPRLKLGPNWIASAIIGNAPPARGGPRSGYCGSEQALWYLLVELELRLDIAISVADPAISMARRTADAEPACIPWIHDLSQSHDARGPLGFNLGVSLGRGDIRREFYTPILRTSYSMHTPSTPNGARFAAMPHFPGYHNTCSRPACSSFLVILLPP